jgi:succinyl-CoA synthetase beta subunit
VEEALKAYDKLNCDKVVIKAQIHAGGRGKGGGVKLAHTKEEVKELAGNILGMNLVTHQTGPEGKEVQRLLIESGVNIQNEFYAGIVLDRIKKQYVFMVSTEGGVEIEKVAAETPEKIIKIWIDSERGLTQEQAVSLGKSLNLTERQIVSSTDIFMALWNVFNEMDCSLLEINPLVVTQENELVALDAKMNFDSNAIFRHPELNDLRDESEEDPAELKASKHQLNYIKLDGNVGCMVNGAGSSSLSSRRSLSSGCLKMALESKFIFASRAITSFSCVTTRGFISKREQSISLNTFQRAIKISVDDTICLSVRFSDFPSETACS